MDHEPPPPSAVPTVPSKKIIAGIQADLRKRQVLALATEIYKRRPTYGVDDAIKLAAEFVDGAELAFNLLD